MVVCFAVTVQPDSKYLQGNLHDISLILLKTFKVSESFHFYILIKSHKEL